MSLKLLAAMETMGSEQLQDSSALLWPGGAPEARGTDVTDQPGLTIHLPDTELATGAGIVICPGGGFTKLASDNEGLHVARWLNSIGVAAFVLRYRLRPKYEPDISLLDAQRAIRHVRFHAASYDVDPNRIGVLGFSAGGNLAAGTAVLPGSRTGTDPIDNVSSRPDFVVTVYPVVDPSHPELVTAETPPTFLVVTHEDLSHRIRSTLPFYEALLENEVPAEMHLFNRGTHGTGLAPGDPSLGQWPGLLVEWLRTSGLLTAKKRTAVSGVVTIDGEPLLWGGVILIPEDTNAPVARVFSGSQFSIDATRGPVPGPHRVEVHLLSRDFSDMARGTYSMDGPEHYTKPSPGAEAPLQVEIVPGRKLEIAIKTVPASTPP